MSVKEFVEQNNRPNPFKDNMPGNKWYNGFLRRHPEIACRTPEGVTAASACVSEENIRGWFKSVEDILKEENVFDILSDPERVFNGDETNFMLCPKKNLVLAPTGSKNVYEVENSQAKATLTVMCTFSASGMTCPPMIIYPLQRIPQDIIRNVPENWGIGRSDNGWMKSEVFFEFIGNVFYPYLVQNNIQLPVVLFVDGHKTHLTYHLSELCKELKIILIALYPNSTRILQPADVAAFKPVKNKWKDAVLAWRAQHLNKAVTKEDFAPILETMLQNIDLQSSLKNGFRATGLYPWNADAVDFSKCIGKKVPSTNGPSNDVNTTLPEMQPLPYADFCKIVGQNRIEKFKNIKKIVEDEEHGEEFFVLYRLYEHYHDMKVKHTAQSSEGRAVTPETPEINTQVAPENITDDSLEFLSAGPPQLEKNNVNQEDHTTTTQPESKNTANVGEENTEILSSTVFLMDKNNANQEDNAPATPTKENNLQQILVWPETPKRKGKTNTERVPFVLTSGKWKEAHDKKEKLKEEANREKEKRKEKREKKKIMKEELQKERVEIGKRKDCCEKDQQKSKGSEEVSY